MIEENDISAALHQRMSEHVTGDPGPIGGRVNPRDFGLFQGHSKDFRFVPLCVCVFGIFLFIYFVLCLRLTGVL